jgi:hypothetical protein
MRILKNKKAAYFLTIVSVLLVVALVTFVVLVNRAQTNSNKDGYVGAKSAKLIQAYQAGEKTLFYIDMAAKYAAPTAYFMTAFYDGGMKGCGEYYNFNLWDLEDENCLPMKGNVPSDKFKSAFEFEMNDKLNEYFKMSGMDQLKIDNYDINIFDEKGKLVVTGDTKTPLEFEIERGSTNPQGYNPLTFSYAQEQFANNPRINYLLAHNKYVTPEFLNKVVEVATDLRADPLHLMIIMYWETGTSMSPAQYNPYGCVGLIQFCPGKDSGMDLVGETGASLSAMTAVEQLDGPVREYLKKIQQQHKMSSYNTLAQFYLAVLLPAVIEEANSPTAIVFHRGGRHYSANCQAFVGKSCARDVLVSDIEKGPRQKWASIPEQSVVSQTK